MGGGRGTRAMDFGWKVQAKLRFEGAGSIEFSRCVVGGGQSPEPWILVEGVCGKLNFANVLRVVAGALKPWILVGRCEQCTVWHCARVAAGSPA